jgi:hypothetical protein
MEQAIVVIVAVFAALLLVYAFLRRPPSKWVDSDPGTASDSALEEGNGSRYPAVSIRTSRNGCPAAEALRGQRFLPDEAPPLPLPHCTWARCNCKYSHHVDRRSGNLDRRKMIGEERDYPLSMGDDDPRAGRGRRVRDLTTPVS